MIARKEDYVNVFLLKDNIQDVFLNASQSAGFI